MCLTYFFNSSREVLNKKFTKVVESLEFTSLQSDEREGEREREVKVVRGVGGYLPDHWLPRQPSGFNNK